MAIITDANTTNAMLQGGYMRVELIALARPGGLLPNHWQAQLNLYTTGPNDHGNCGELLGSTYIHVDYVEGGDPFKLAYAKARELHKRGMLQFNRWSPHLGGDC